MKFMYTNQSDITPSFPLVVDVPDHVDGLKLNDIKWIGESIREDVIFSTYFQKRKFLVAKHKCTLPGARDTCPPTHLHAAQRKCHLIPWPPLQCRFPCTVLDLMEVSCIHSQTHVWPLRVVLWSSPRWSGQCSCPHNQSRHSSWLRKTKNRRGESRPI
jgi:hypothetical protein